MNDAVVAQLTGQHGANVSAISQKPGNMDVISMDQATVARWVNSVPIKERHVLVIIIIIRKEQNYVFAVPRFPSSLLEC